MGALDSQTSVHFALTSGFRFIEKMRASKNTLVTYDFADAGVEVAYLELRLMDLHNKQAESGRFLENVFFD